MHAGAHRALYDNHRDNVKLAVVVKSIADVDLIDVMQEQRQVHGRPTLAVRTNQPNYIR